MKKQVGKSKVFTKESLTAIQDKMRNACIKSYNKFYGVDSRLKTKQKGRNQDINVNEMDNYREIKKRLEQQRQKLENATSKIESENYSLKEQIKIKDDLLKDWLEFREETAFSEMTPQDKKYSLFFVEISTFY